MKKPVQPKRKKPSVKPLPFPYDRVVQYCFVAQFERLLYQKAWNSWRKLPPTVKIWMDPEDLYQELYGEALRCFARWDPKRKDGATFSTYVYRCLDNYLISFAARWNTKKRLPAFQVELSVADREVQSPSHEIIPDIILMQFFQGAIA